MSIKFVATQNLVQAAAVSATLPFTAGFWFFPTTQGVVWNWAANATDIGWRSEWFSATGEIAMHYFNGTGNVGQITIGGLTIGAWNYCLQRFISATNRRNTVLGANGVATFGQTTVSVTPGTLVKIGLGSVTSNSTYAGIGGCIAEFFVTKTDVQPGGGQTDDGLLRQLAYGGPWSVPHVASNIMEYRSFRRGLATNSDAVGEVWSRGGPWAGTAPTLWAHPPLPDSYVRPSPPLVRPLLV